MFHRTRLPADAIGAVPPCLASGRGVASASSISTVSPRRTATTIVLNRINSAAVACSSAIEEARMCLVTSNEWMVSVGLGDGLAPNGEARQCITPPSLSSIS